MRRKPFEVEALSGRCRFIALRASRYSHAETQCSTIAPARNELINRRADVKSAPAFRAIFFTES
jgi:hypothetical protein